MEAHFETTDALETRRVALQILSTVLDKKQPLDQALDKSQGLRDLGDTRDRAFVRMMVTTLLRRLGQVDDLIKRAASDPSKDIKPPLLKHILRLGITQLVFMDVPDYAAVNTSVEIAIENKLGKTKGFVNAVLRNIARQGKNWTTQQDIPRLNTPEWILQEWVKDYDLATAIKIGEAHIIEPALDLTLKSQDRENVDYWKSHLQGEVLPNGSLRITKAGRIEDLQGYNAGAWWVQDIAASLPATLFGDLTDKHIADVCAAPGGKTAQLAAQGAQVTALDRSARRLVRFRENLERLNLLTNVQTEAADASVWSPKAELDGVLLDAPCTASGTIRKHPDMPWIKDISDLKTLVSHQRQILKNMAQHIKIGGVLIYCTCSLFKAEGEDQIDAFLAEHKNFDPIVKEELGGMSEMITKTGDVRALPFHLQTLGGMDGFYISRLVRRA